MGLNGNGGEELKYLLALFLVFFFSGIGFVTGARTHTENEKSIFRQGISYGLWTAQTFFNPNEPRDQMHTEKEWQKYGDSLHLNGKESR